MKYSDYLLETNPILLNDNHNLNLFSDSLLNSMGFANILGIDNIIIYQNQMNKQFTLKIGDINTNLCKDSLTAL